MIRGNVLSLLLWNIVLFHSFSFFILHLACAKKFDQTHMESNKGSRGRAIYYSTFDSFVSWVFYIGVSFCIILLKKNLHLASISFFKLKAHKTTRVQGSLLDFDGFLLIQKAPSVFYLGGMEKNISFRHCSYCATYL